MMGSKQVKEITVKDIPPAIKSVYLTGYGGYKKLKVKYAQPPTDLKDGHILVSVKACGMNFSDLVTRQGIHTFKGWKPPFIMGLECSGIVEEVAFDVHSVRVGDRVVCWSFNYGMWTEQASVPETHCLPIPDSMTFEEAVAFPIQYVTAYLAVIDFGHLRPGQSVFIQAIAGGVGWAATQIARTVPNVTIIGTTSAIKHDIVRENGVDYAIDYTRIDFATAVKEVAPLGVDVVLDCLAGKGLIKAQSLLKPMGRIISIGVTSMFSGEKRNFLKNIIVWFQTKKVSFLNLLMKNRAVCGINVGTLMAKDPHRFRETLSKLFELYTHGRIKPKIDSVYSFEEVVEATKRMVERKNIGKVVLVPTTSEI